MMHPGRRIREGGKPGANDDGVDDDAQDRGNDGCDHERAVAVDERKAKDDDRGRGCDVEQWNWDRGEQREKEADEADQAGCRGAGERRQARLEDALDPPLEPADLADEPTKLLLGDAAPVEAGGEPRA